MAPSRKASDPLVIEDLIRRRHPKEDQRLVSELAAIWSGALDGRSRAPAQGFPGPHL